MIISKLIVELLVTILFFDVVRYNDDRFIKKTDGDLVKISNLNNDDIIMLFSVWLIVSLFIWVQIKMYIFKLKRWV